LDNAKNVEKFDVKLEREEEKTKSLECASDCTDVGSLERERRELWKE